VFAGLAGLISIDPMSKTCILFTLVGQSHASVSIRHKNGPK